MSGKFYKMAYVFAAFYGITFVIDTIADYAMYDPVLNSAPFSAFVIANAIECFIPGLILLLMGIFMKRKYDRANGKNEK